MRKPRCDTRELRIYLFPKNAPVSLTQDSSFGSNSCATETHQKFWSRLEYFWYTRLKTENPKVGDDSFSLFLFFTPDHWSSSYYYYIFLFCVEIDRRRTILHFDWAKIEVKVWWDAFVCFKFKFRFWPAFYVKKYLDHQVWVTQRFRSSCQALRNIWALSALHSVASLPAMKSSIPKMKNRLFRGWVGFYLE